MNYTRKRATSFKKGTENPARAPWNTVTFTRVHLGRLQQVRILPAPVLDNRLTPMTLHGVTQVSRRVHSFPQLRCELTEDRGGHIKVTQHRRESAVEAAAAGPLGCARPPASDSARELRGNQRGLLSLSTPKVKEAEAAGIDGGTDTCPEVPLLFTKPPQVGSSKLGRGRGPRPGGSPPSLALPAAPLCLTPIP